MRIPHPSLCLALALALVGCHSEPPTPTPVRRPTVVVPPIRTAPPPVEPAAQTRPDVILIIIDTLRADRLSLYGNPRKTSPNLDALAEKGWVFEQVVGQSGWTLPATGSILSGLLPTEHGGTRDAEDPRRFGRFEPSTPTIAEAFAAEGYRTGAVVNNTFLAPQFGFNRGFTYYDYRGATNMAHRSALETVEAGLAWLDASDTPAFLLLHFMEPHASYVPRGKAHGIFAPTGEALKVPLPFHLAHGREPKKPLTRAQKDQVVALYDEEVHVADAAVGRLVSGLENRSRLDETWLWVTSDHGEEFWDHQGFEHGHHLLGELTRVPLIGVGPGVTPRRVKEPVAQLDLHATLVGQSGHLPENPGRGVDLLAALQGELTLDPDRAIISEDCLYGDWRSAITRGGFRLQADHANRKAVLFTVDATAQNDRRVKDPALIQAHHGALLELMRGLRGGRGAPRITEAREALDLAEDEVEQLRALGYVQ